MADWQVGCSDVDEYFTTVGMDREAPGLDYLCRLHEAHVTTFPFANVDVLLRRHPGVAPATVFDQLVRRRTGGYCLEHVPLLAGVLEHLGFEVQRCFGRPHAVDNSRAHMTAVVTLDGVDHLCSSGFGAGLRRPLPLADGASVTQGGCAFTLRDVGEGPGQVWELSRDGVLQHLVDALPVLPVDVADCHAFLGVGDGTFPTSLMAMRFIDGGHVTVTHTARTVRLDGRETTREDLTPDQVVDAVQELGVEVESERAEALLAKVRELQAG